jgi:hypothetical protein
VAGDGGWGFCLRTLGAMAGRQGTEGPGCFSGGCPTGWMVGPRLGTGSKKPPAQENVLGVRRAAGSVSPACVFNMGWHGNWGHPGEASPDKQLLCGGRPLYRRGRPVMYYKNGRASPGTHG